MTVRDVERAIIAEARTKLMRPKLRLKDLLEWCTTKEPVEKRLRDGEEMHYLPEMQVWIAVPQEKTKAKRDAKK